MASPDFKSRIIRVVGGHRIPSQSTLPFDLSIPQARLSVFTNVADNLS